MSNRTEARSAKAARMHATGRLPLLRLFSTPLIDQRSKREMAWVQQLSTGSPVFETSIGNNED